MGTREPVTSDQELLEAIQLVCDRENDPVVPTAEVANVEFIQIQRQAVHDRLDKLADEGRVQRVVLDEAKQWKAWRVPDDEDVDADYSKMNWDAIDGSDIPRETIEEHPEYHTPTRWESTVENGRTIIQYVIYSLLIGSSLMLLRGYYAPIVEENAEIVYSVGAVLLVAGFGFGIFGIGLVLVGVLGQILVNRGWGETYESITGQLKAGVSKRIPISVSFAWREKSSDALEQEQ